MGHTGDEGSEFRTVTALVGLNMFTAFVIITVVVILCSKGCRNRKKLDIHSEENKRTCNLTESEDTNRNFELQNGRPVSHDRALPEIPAASSGITSTDDDDEEDEGHYDFITRNKKSFSVTAQLCSNVLDTETLNVSPDGVSAIAIAAKSLRTNGYEIVGSDLDSCSTHNNENVDVIQSLRICENRGVGMNFVPSQPCHVAYDVCRMPEPFVSSVCNAFQGEQLYSVANDQRASLAESKVHCVEGRRVARSKVRQGHSSQVTAEDSKGGQLSLPPSVPDKRYIFGEEGDGVTSPESLCAGNRHVLGSSSSPSLPPRNSDGACAFVWTTELSGGATAVEANVSELLFSPTGAALQWGSADTFPLIDADNSNRVDDLSISAAVSHVPDYSSVSARESLENLRKRQSINHLREAVLTDLHEETYDTINYDKVKTSRNEPTVGEQFSIGEHLYSNGSDLYAEIGTDPNSAYSSAYARISNLSTAQLDAADTRPLPPSIETLQQLAHESLMDDLVDPGYSRLDGQRSSLNVAETVPHHNLSTSLTSSISFSGTRPPVYAVVSRGVQQRQLINREMGIEARAVDNVISDDHETLSNDRERAHEIIDRDQSITAIDRVASENIYAEVTKTRLHCQSRFVEPSNTAIASSNSKRGSLQNLSGDECDDIIDIASNKVAATTRTSDLDLDVVENEITMHNVKSRFKQSVVNNLPIPDVASNTEEHFEGLVDATFTLASRERSVNHLLNNVSRREHIYEVVSESRSELCSLNRNSESRVADSISQTKTDVLTDSILELDQI